MHLCRDRGFPDLLRAVRRLLGWENARGLRREIFCPFPAAVTVTDRHPHSQNPSDIGIPFSYYLSDLDQGYSRLPTSRLLKFLAREAKEKKRASTKSRSNRASEGVASSRNNQPGKKSKGTFRKSRVTGDAHITVTPLPTFPDHARLTFLHNPPSLSLTLFSRRFYYSGTRLIRTPRGHAIVSVLSGCPY